MRHSPGTTRSADLGLRLGALEELRQGRSPDHRMNKGALNSILRVSDNLLRRAGKRSFYKQILSEGALLSLAFPERIAARRRGGDGQYLMASGRGAILPRDDGLIVADYLAIAHMDAGVREGRIWLALPLELGELESICERRIQVIDHLSWDKQAQRVVGRTERRLGQIVLSSRVIPVDDEDQAAKILLKELDDLGPAVLGWNDEARQLQARLLLAAKCFPDQRWPDVSNEWLSANMGTWLAPWIAGMRTLKEIQKIDLNKIFFALLDWEQRQRLDQLLPLRLEMTSGSSYRIDYVDREIPVLSLPLQEMYGIKETPLLANGKLAVVVELLSPAGRPLQVTRDLEHFWNHAYTEVKKEMKGRYPKHYWPDDPVKADPIRLKKQVQ